MVPLLSSYGCGPGKIVVGADVHSSGVFCEVSTELSLEFDIFSGVDHSVNNGLFNAFCHGFNHGGWVVVFGRLYGLESDGFAVSECTRGDVFSVEGFDSAGVLNAVVHGKLVE